MRWLTSLAFDEAAPQAEIEEAENRLWLARVGSLDVYPASATSFSAVRGLPEEIGRARPAGGEQRADEAQADLSKPLVLPKADGLTAEV